MNMHWCACIIFPALVQLLDSGGAQHVQPEQLDVLRTRIMADRVDHLVVPGHDHEDGVGEGGVGGGEGHGDLR